MPKPNPEVRIISDGTPWGTTIEVDGRRLTSVTKITWKIDVDEPARVTLELDRVAVEVTGELTKAELAELVG